MRCYPIHEASLDSMLFGRDFPACPGPGNIFLVSFDQAAQRHLLSADGHYWLNLVFVRDVTFHVPLQCNAMQCKRK